jgi:hypothetical protein
LKEWTESPGIIAGPQLLGTNVIAEPMVGFDLAGFISAEQIESSVFGLSNDYFKAETIAPTSPTADSHCFFSISDSERDL